MKKFSKGLIALIFALPLVTVLNSAQAAEITVSGVKFSWSNQVYAPQSASENEYLVVNYENTSSKDFWTVGFSTEEPSGKMFLFFGAVPGVKAGTKGEIRVSLNYLAFLNVRGPIDYKINLCTRIALLDPEVCSKSTLTFITEKPKTISSPSPSVQTCAAGGDCKVGDVGPGGGRIVYVSPSLQSWGRFIESAPSGWFRGGLDPQKKPFCPEVNTKMARLKLDGSIGSGLRNSIEIRKECPSGAVAMAMAYEGGGKKDWFLPSIEELKEVYYSKYLRSDNHYWYWSSTIDASTVHYTIVGTNTSGGFTIESLYSSDGHTSGNSSDTNDFRVRPIRYGMSDIDKRTLEAKAEAEAKAKAEAEAKAKAEAEAKAKAEAEAKAKLEAAKKKTTITCVKGKVTKKVTAVNPKCPKGYKKR